MTLFCGHGELNVSCSGISPLEKSWGFFWVFFKLSTVFKFMVHLFNTLVFAFLLCSHCQCYKTIFRLCRDIHKISVLFNLLFSAEIKSKMCKTTAYFVIQTILLYNGNLYQGT